jgi:hypothetical protein
MPAAPPAPPPPPAAPTPTAEDPHALGSAIGRLSGGGLLGGPKKAAKAPATALGVLLQPGELVECLVQGSFSGDDAVVALTTQRLIVISAHEWVPAVVQHRVDASLAVQGMQDERTATLTFTSGTQVSQVDRIADRPLAMELAQRIRARIG